jgi:amidase
VVPISASQDTAGPMTRNVADAAAMLTALAGTDPVDPATAEADKRKSDYLAGLKPDALKGARLGVLRGPAGRNHPVDAVYERTLAVLKAQGAILVEVKTPDLTTVGKAEDQILKTEFKVGVAAYLASTDPAKVKTRTLADLIAFNKAEPRETPLFGQEVFEESEATTGLDEPAYVQARIDGKRLAGLEGVDKLLAEAKVEALVAPSGGPASVVDPINGSRWLGSPSTLPAVSGYPHLTVPMGEVSGLPVGVSFIGPAWSEARLLSLGYAFEQATRARITPTFAPSVNVRPEIAGAYDVAK